MKVMGKQLFGHRQTASAKALGQECTQQVPGTARRPDSLERRKRRGCCRGRYERGEGVGANHTGLIGFWKDVGFSSEQDGKRKP